MAEREGFEPSMTLLPYRFSKPARSTTLPPLQGDFSLNTVYHTTTIPPCYTLTMNIVVGGPMFSGKTTWLIEYTKKLQDNSYVIYKPNLDTRYATNAIVTHHGQSLPATNINYLNPQIPKLGRSIKTILFDELNFFSFNTLFSEIQRQNKLGRDIVGVGLLFDSKKNPFGATLPLSKYVHAFIELFSICDGCGKKANHSYRKIQLKKQIAIGASEIYGACCEKCWADLQR